MQTIKLNASESSSVVNCSVCGKPSQIKIDYARLNLCADCFSIRFEKKILEANKKYSFFRRKDKIALAISGGKDSASLLVSLHKICKKIGDIELTPILIDEGIDGYRNVACKKAEELCEQFGYTLNIFSYKNLFGGTLDDAMENRHNLVKTKDSRPLHSCGYCGIFRKQALNIAAKEVGANKLALGHNADDIAQSLIMNLLGRHTDRLSQSNPIIHAKSKEGLIQRIKPLAFSTEMECALYAKLNSAPFHLGGCPYANESLRGMVKDFLNQVENQIPGTKLNLVESSIELFNDLKKPEKNYRLLKKCKTCGEPSSDSKNDLCRSCQIIQQLGFSMRQEDQHE